MSDVAIQRFLPDGCFEAASVAEFYETLADFDETLAAIAKEAHQKGQVLRFMGTLENGKALLSLKAVGPDHPFYHLSDTDNIASISSHYYSKNPVVIKGPGAGASITAASVLSNIVQAGLGN
jgi:aspartokinase/homoserine dehydrogenase 1